MRTKLDEKSLRCFLLGISEESKAYKLYDPISQQIVVSRDVVFDESAEWEWDKKHELAISCELEREGDEEALTEESLAEDNVTNTLSEESLGINQETSLDCVEWRSRRQPIWMKRLCYG